MDTKHDTYQIIAHKLDPYATVKAEKNYPLSRCLEHAHKAISDAEKFYNKNDFTNQAYNIFHDIIPNHPDYQHKHPHYCRSLENLHKKQEDIVKSINICLKNIAHTEVDYYEPILSPKNIKKTKNDTTTVGKINIPKKLIKKFIEVVEPFTEKRIESCGVLAGCPLENGSGFIITTIVLPRQDGYIDSCEVTDEMELFECLTTNNLIALGWIHTHPIYDLFLSSIDLHTQWGYQTLLKESVAIVYSPIKEQKLAVFRIKDEYMDEIQKCNSRGFHSHTEKSENMYEESEHVEFVDKYGHNTVQLFDFREKK